MTAKGTKTIVVLGASFVGLTIAHRILKKTLNTTSDYKLILVAPSTHHYFNIAAPRAIVPGQLSDDKILADIRPGFKQYPSDKFTFILGTATSLTPSSKTVTITPTDGSVIEQKYDVLIIATGSRPASPGPWKTSLKGHEETLKDLHDTQAAVGKAKTIVIGGGGATGVETAAEIKFEYGSKKEVTLITAGDRLISTLVPQGVHNAAVNELKKLNVPIVFSTKVVSTSALPSGQTEITLSTGEKKTVDLYIPTLGMVQNTEFVPAELLNDKKEVKVDEFFRVKGVEDVWAAGDAADTQPNQLAYGQAQAAQLAKNFDHHVKGQALEPYKAMGPLIVVTIGRSKGTGHFGTWKFPSLVVWLMKGRTMFLGNLKPLVEGNA